jgi:hypothetical protein
VGILTQYFYSSIRIEKINFFLLPSYFFVVFKLIMINICSIENSILSEHWGAEFRKGGKKMKKLIVLLFMGLLIAGCSSEFYKHDTLFKDWDHVKFSWWGYKNPTAEDAKMSDQQGWWGEAIPYIPAE